MSGGQFTITPADDATSVPAEGFTPGGNFRLDVMGGDTIEAELHFLQPDGSYKKVPSTEANIDTDYSKLIIAAPGDTYKILVTTATGTWYAKHSRVVA